MILGESAHSTRTAPALLNVAVRTLTPFSTTCRCSLGSLALIEAERPLQSEERTHQHDRMSDLLLGDGLSVDPAVRNHRGGCNDQPAEHNANTPVTNLERTHEIPHFIGPIRLHRVSGQFPVHRRTDAEIEHLQRHQQRDIETNETVGT